VPFESEVLPAADVFVIVTGHEVVAAGDTSFQLTPPSVVYWYFVMADPPFVAFVHATDRVALPGVITTLVGAVGAVAAAEGVTETEDEAADEPAELIALRVIEYVVPLVRPGIVRGQLASTGLKAV
jgi:hypothetical protein